jgi:hypothetical protein
MVFFPLVRFIEQLNPFGSPEAVVIDDVPVPDSTENRVSTCAERAIPSKDTTVAVRPPCSEAPKLYKRLERSGALSGWTERTQDTVKNCLMKADQLMDQGKYVFTHSHTLPIAAVTDLLTDFQLGPNRAVTDRVWRVAGAAEPVKNIDDFRRSQLYGKVDNYHRQSFLSVDGDLTTTTESAAGGSAICFLNNGINRVTSCQNSLEKRFFSNRARELVELSGIQSSEYRKMFKDNLKDFFKGIETVGRVSRVNLIAIPRLLLESPETCFVYRSHPGGIECTCLETTHQVFISTLKKAQAGTSFNCQSTSCTPQYRMLTYGLQCAKGIETYTFDNVTPEQKKRYSDEYARILSLRDMYLESEGAVNATGKVPCKK